MARMPLERRLATLLAFVRTLKATSQDDVLDLLYIVDKAVQRRCQDRQACPVCALSAILMRLPSSCGWLVLCS
ncbi:hypothetical protein [Lichenicoccus sp.]|uniref:hypothetical protein n=1 Tax=Lichenicoccus sp. TaxID=2781899 RepID=UPI003D0FC385